MDDKTTIQMALARAEELRPHFVHITRQLFPIRQKGSGGITADRYLRLYYDRKAIEEWQPDWAAAEVLVHVEHYKRRHPQRQRGRNPFLWGVSTRLAVVENLAGEKIRFHPGTLFAEDFRLPEDLLAEDYYLRLWHATSNRRRQVEQQVSDMVGGQAMPLVGSSSVEEMQEWERPATDNVPTVDYLVATMMQQEFMQTHRSKPGKGAGNEERSTAEVRAAAVDWRTVLRGLLGTVICNRPGMADYSFLVPDPDLGLHPGLIMPGMIGTRANLAVVGDSSGSMGDSRIAQVHAETGRIVKTFEGEAGVLFYSCDAAVHQARTIYHPQQIRLVGGGGTDMGIGIKAAASNFPPPDAIIVITDGDTTWPKKGPEGIRVIVVLVGNGSSPPWAYRVLKVPMD